MKCVYQQSMAAVAAALLRDLQLEYVDMVP